ncbi:MAG: lysophospholipid acyltransferase family protein [Desulfobacter sp.]|nr:MAG: lysophospholipid acyltransferase family protein [Desulfobacter sp.]
MKPSVLNNPVLKPVFYFIARAGLAIFGWRVQGRMPDLKKFILIAAPHSSNWDFVFFLFAIFKLQVPVHWMGKHTMFPLPFRHLLQRLGGIPIDRTQKGDTVKTMANEFSSADRLVVTIAPSGTRQRVTKWKTGFYRIASAAGVPIVLGFIDYKKKVIGIGPAVIPTGHLDSDMKKIQLFYRNKSGRYDQ